MDTYPQVVTKFINRRSVFCNFFDIAKLIAFQLKSKNLSLCRKCPDMIGVDLFIKIISTSESIVKLLPKSDDDFTDKFLDYYSIFSLTRNIIEASEKVFYIFENTDNHDERFFKIKQLELTDTNIWISKLGNIIENEQKEKQELEQKIKQAQDLKLTLELTRVLEEKQDIIKSWGKDRSKHLERKEELLKEIECNTIYKKLSSSAKDKLKDIKKDFFKIVKSKSENSEDLELADSDMYKLEDEMEYLKTDTSRFAYFICSAVSHSQSSTVNSFLFYSIEGCIYALDNIATALALSSVYLANSSKIFIDKVIPNINTIYEQYSDVDIKQLRNAFVYLDQAAKIIKI